MRKHTIVIISVLSLMIFMSILFLPKFYAAFNQVDDLTVQVSEETIQQGENLTLTVQDQSEQDTKVTLPLPEGLTYQNTYSGNASVTYDAANQQIVIDWVEGQARQVQLTLLAEASGTYSLQASTIREDNPVESAPVSVLVEEAVADEKDSQTMEAPDTSDTTSATDSSNSDEEQSAKQNGTVEQKQTLQTDNNQLQATSKTFNEWFPDDALAGEVAENLGKNPTDEVTDTELATVRELFVRYPTSDMSGIEHLTGLLTLECKSLILKELDVSQNTNLIVLDCPGNNFTELDISNNPKLQILDCGVNNLTYLDISQCPDLIYFYCDNNAIPEINVGQNSLSQLKGCAVHNNQLVDFSFFPDTWVPYSEPIPEYGGIRLREGCYTGFAASGQKRTLSQKVTSNNQLSLPVEENLKDNQGGEMIITPSDGGVYDSDTNTITWTNLARSGTVSYQFDATFSVSLDESQGPPGGTITIPYATDSIDLSCEDEITYIEGTPKSGDDFLSDIHATTDEGCTLSSDFITAVNMKQSGDYTVNVTANDPDLELETTKEVIVHVIPYTLQFSTPPSDLTFETSAVEQGQQEISRAEDMGSYSFAIEDTRAADAHWRLNARIEAPLTATDGDQLNNALIYKKNGQETILTPGNAVEITNSEEQTKDDAQFDISWQENEGLLLDVNTNIIQATTYQTTLYWDLLDTP